VSFSNLQVSPADLPDADQVTWHPLHKNYKFAVLIETALTVGFIFVVAGVIAFYFANETPLQSILFYVAVAGLFIGMAYAIATLLAIRFHGFAIREHDVLYRCGLFFRKRVVVPIARIQHVEVGSGPLERLLGLARLQVFTAGTAGSDLRIRGIDEETADSLRRYLLKRTKRAG
jgi:membrane protein YdbS with pleckstrin-like domain